MDELLNREQQIKILKLARNTIAGKLGLSLPFPDLELNEQVFKEKFGAFVTLHIRGSLRGCIGYIKGIKEISETIIDMSKASAFDDPRFASLKKDEFEKIDIEVSILSPIEEVKSISDIVIGRDGLIIKKGFKSGLLLPQVAVEQKWGLEEFLMNTCFKAGLSPQAWKEKDTKLEKFSAQVFGEIELGLKK